MYWPSQNEMKGIWQENSDFSISDIIWHDLLMILCIKHKNCCATSPRYEHMGTWKPHQGFLIATGNATSVNTYPQIMFESVGAVCKKQHCMTICAAVSFICLYCWSFRYYTGSRQKEFRCRDNNLPGYIRLLWVSLWMTIWILSHESSLPLKSQTVTSNSLVYLARQKNNIFFSVWLF